MPSMDIAEVKEYLPHRYPFLLIDRVLDYKTGEWMQGIKNVSINEPFFQGHFPDHPIMPGVLIVESLAQLSGILAFVTKGMSPADGHLYYLAGTNNSRFKKPVTPGDQLQLHSEVANERNQMMKFACTAKVNDRIVCTTDLLVAGIDLNDG